MAHSPRISRPNDLPHWRRPPIDEVAISVQFNDIVGLKIVHFGRLAGVLQKHGLNQFQDKPPVQPVFEVFSKRAPEQVQFGVQAVEFPMPRVWYISDDQHRLAQFQSDRFIYNWRRVEGAGEYPRLENVMQQFFKCRASLQTFLAKEDLPPINVNQAELTYVNLIEVGAEETFASAFARVFSVWDGQKAPLALSRGCVEAEAIRFAYTHFVKSTEDEPVARIHVNAVPSFRETKKVIRLTLVFRGPTLQNTDDETHLTSFFSLGREAIVRTFDNIITEDTHSAWGRYEGQKERDDE